MTQAEIDLHLETYLARLQRIEQEAANRLRAADEVALKFASIVDEMDAWRANMRQSLEAWRQTIATFDEAISNRNRN